ncbi:dihydrodipicolinate synthase family protein [Nocardia wallacei]|uniref:dihydrodipicolinate synthase family protein n=1 Tax=Nocardia wallacei TaxID=480035 RepID=UPI002457DF50|nr:dihydrodipicolinate synthase family protein [Nocardia wallacei]
MTVSPIVAVIVPFRADGTIEFTALGDYLALLDHAGVTSVLVNGTSGEFASLTMAERRQVTEFCRAAWPHHLIVHVGATTTADVIDLIQHANNLTDQLAVIAPYFFADPPEAGVERFFTEVLDFCRKPVLLYNFPRHTQADLPPALVARLAERFPAVCGVKDSGKDREVTRQYKALCPRLQVLAGDDRIGPRAPELGIDGGVSGAGGPVAELPVAIAAAARAGLVDQAQRWQAVFDRYTDTRKALPLSEIAFAKAALSARLPGFPAHMRAPLLTATTDQQDTIRTFMRDTMIGALPRR